MKYQVIMNWSFGAPLACLELGDLWCLRDYAIGDWKRGCSYLVVLVFFILYEYNFSLLISFWRGFDHG
jgi:hypothetical protein